MNTCVGLFGTCGDSQWRDRFIENYDNLDIKYFNPVVPDWNPAMAKEEAKHLAEDSVILFPVLEETYAFGSLSEVGFSILQSIRLDERRDFVILIKDHLTDELMKDEDKAKDSLKSRALVYQHLKKLQFTNLYLVNTLDEMLEVSINLYQTHETLIKYKMKFNPHRREY